MLIEPKINSTEQYKITLGNFFSVLYSGQKSVLIEGIKRMCNTTITLKFGRK